MIRGRWKKCSCALAAVLCLSGCWDSYDPEDRRYIFSVGVERSEEQYRFSFVNAAKQEEEAEIYSVEADSLAEACALAEKEASGHIYLGQWKTILLGESLLAEADALTALLDEVERNSEVPAKVMVLAANEAQQSVEQLAKEDGGLFLWEFYQNTAEHMAIVKGVDLDSLSAAFTRQDGYAIVPRIVLTEENRIALDGCSLLLPDGGSVVWDTAKERGYLFLQGKGEGAFLEIEEGETRLPFSVTKVKGSTELTDSACRVNLEVWGQVLGGISDEAFERERIEEIEKAAALRIKQEMENTIKTAEEAGALSVLRPDGEVRENWEISVFVTATSIGRKK